VALVSGAVLRPALKYNGEIYIAPLNGQHLDALPPQLVDEFRHRSLTGKDISKFNFGFINDKSDFLNREDALTYAIDVGLLNLNSAQYMSLTSTMLLEGAQHGKAIEDLNEGDPAEFESGKGS